MQNISTCYFLTVTETNGTFQNALNTYGTYANPLKTWKAGGQPMEAYGKKQGHSMGEFH